MKCYPCGFEGARKDFGSASVGGGGGDGYGAALTARMPTRYIGTVDIFVCPNCGALHSDMRGAIAASDRK